MIILKCLAIPTFKLVVFGKSDEISRLIEMDDSCIIVINSENRIHYFKRFVEDAMPDDLQYISKMVPYLNQKMIEKLAYLQTGDALVFGSAINLPTLTKFDQANPTTDSDSDNAKISEKWYIEWNT